PVGAIDPGKRDALAVLHGTGQVDVDFPAGERRVDRGGQVERQSWTLEQLADEPRLTLDPNTVSTAAVRSSVNRGSSASCSSVLAPSRVNGPTVVRRSRPRCPPTPSATPRSRARART